MTSKSAVLLGGTGQIGLATARHLTASGWAVTLVSRRGDVPGDLKELGVRGARADRTVTGELEAALGSGADVLVDMVAFSAHDAGQLNGFHEYVGSMIVISSAAVYADDRGRMLDEAKSVDTFPHLPVPIPESHRTAAPSDKTYSTRKIAMERGLLDGPAEATVIRPCAVHGPGSNAPRELFFVRRMLDGRKIVVLTSNGESRFHTTSVDNLAELIRLAAERPAKRILNCGDPDPPTVRDIRRAVAAALNHHFEEVLLSENGYDRPEFSNPWAVPVPFVVDMTAAERELGYEPITRYAEAVRATCAWLAEEAVHRDFSETYLSRYFNYDVEDKLLAERGRSPK
jgi:nucleoside-diphosphate-sugar epimerase